MVDRAERSHHRADGRFGVGEGLSGHAAARVDHKRERDRGDHRCEGHVRLRRDGPLADLEILRPETRDGFAVHVDDRGDEAHGGEVARVDAAQHDAIRIVGACDPRAEHQQQRRDRRNDERRASKHRSWSSRASPRTQG